MKKSLFLLVALTALSTHSVFAAEQNPNNNGQEMVAEQELQELAAMMAHQKERVQQAREQFAQQEQTTLMLLAEKAQLTGDTSELEAFVASMAERKANLQAAINQMQANFEEEEGNANQ